MADHVLPDYVVGHAVRTTNAAEADPQTAELGSLWQRVTADDALMHLDVRTDDRLYAVLFDYESDENGAYTQIVGVGVDRPSQIPDGVAAVRLSPSRRLPYEATGEMPQGLIAAWSRVWRDTKDGKLKRAYSSDVEVHASDGSATILIATA